MAQISVLSSPFMLLVIAILINQALTCHPSCVCDPNSDVCQSCIDTHSTLDPDSLSCSCETGYYVKTFDPFSCAQSLENYEDPSYSPQVFTSSLEINSCETNIKRYTKYTYINLISNQINIDNKDYLSTDISLVVNLALIPEQCNSYISMKVQYKLANVYLNFPEQLINSTIDSTSSSPEFLQSFSLLLPLSNINEYAVLNSTDTSVISYILSLQVLLGYEHTYLRAETFDLLINFQRNLVFVLNDSVDVNILQTEGCSTGSDNCLVMVDLDTIQTVCTDPTCAQTKDHKEIYQVGDVFYAKIAFADATYTKQLEFVSLYFKNDQNEVYDFSKLAEYTWQNNGLFISLPLVEPSKNAIIQLSLKISPVDGGNNNTLLRRMRNLDNLSSSNSTNSNITGTAPKQQQQQQQVINKSIKFIATIAQPAVVKPNSARILVTLQEIGLLLIFVLII